MNQHHASNQGQWTSGNVVSHLLLFQNLRSDWVFSWDGPSWSVAAEWQIYFLFGMMLLPIWRRLGIAASTVFAVILGWTPHFAEPLGQNFDVACPWFLSLFAFGMLGAVVAVSPHKRWEQARRRVPWAKMTALSTMCILPFYWILRDKELIDRFWFLDCVAAVPILCLILWSATASLGKAGGGRIILRILESRWAQALGTFSYSLYLVHMPIIEQIRTILSPYLARFPVLYLTIQLTVALPIAVGGAYLFYIAVERPCLRIKRAISNRTFV